METEHGAELSQCDVGGPVLRATSDVKQIMPAQGRDQHGRCSAGDTEHSGVKARALTGGRKPVGVVARGWAEVGLSGINCCWGC